MKKIKFLLFGLLLIAGILSCSKDTSENQAVVFGPQGTEITIETANTGGNVTCDEVAAGVGCTFEYTSGKIDYNGETGGNINDIITWTTDGTYVSWESTVPVKIAVIVKGGNDANIFFSGCDDNECVTEGTGLAAPINASGRPAGLSNITFCYSLCEPPEEEPCGETAFAKKTFHEKAHCFSEFGFNNWGWTNGDFGEGNTWYDLYAGAAQCDEASGTYVGKVKIIYSAGSATLIFSTLEGFEMEEIQFHLGNEMFPKDNQDQPTVAPGQYPYIHENLGGVNEKTITVDNLSGRLYFIGHVVIGCPEKEAY